MGSRRVFTVSVGKKHDYSDQFRLNEMCLLRRLCPNFGHVSVTPCVLSRELSDLQQSSAKIS